MFKRDLNCIRVEWCTYRQGQGSKFRPTCKWRFFSVPYALIDKMLKLSTLHTYLNQVLDLPDLHTAILLTPTGQLISYASDPSRSKEDVRSVVGLSGDSFLEVEEQGFATFEIKVRHIYLGLFIVFIFLVGKTSSGINLRLGRERGPRRDSGWLATFDAFGSELFQWL